MYISLFVNFAVAREVIGLVYLTFIPGFLFVKLLKIELGNLEFILYSVGFSVAFLMLAGLAINETRLNRRVQLSPFNPAFIPVRQHSGPCRRRCGTREAEKRKPHFESKPKVFARVLVAVPSAHPEYRGDLLCQCDWKQLLPVNHDCSRRFGFHGCGFQFQVHEHLPICYTHDCHSAVVPDFPVDRVHSAWGKRLS